MSFDQEMDQKMRRRFGDVELDFGQHEGVSKVWRYHRERRRVQPHGKDMSLIQRSRNFFSKFQLPLNMPFVINV
jgi:hypothetical protein